jgi:C_GCAxxG_C_C family probable redox protein
VVVFRICDRINGGEKMAIDNELIVERVKKAAQEYDRHSGCAQSVLLSLQEEFHIGNEQTFMSATALSGGIARHGETCGAIIGALMALNLLIGRKKMVDTERYIGATGLSAELCNRFKEELKNQLGFKEPLKTMLCKEIQEKLYGRSFNLLNEGDYQAFIDAGGHSDTGCLQVCGIAAQVAAEKILSII